MEQLVYKYLYKNYSMSRSNYLSGVVTDKDTDKNLRVDDLIQSVDKVFGIGSKLADILVIKWWDAMELPYIQEELNQSIRR